MLRPGSLTSSFLQHSLHLGLPLQVAAVNVKDPFSNTTATQIPSDWPTFFDFEQSCSSKVPSWFEWFQKERPFLSFTFTDAFVFVFSFYGFVDLKKNTLLMVCRLYFASIAPACWVLMLSTVKKLWAVWAWNIPLWEKVHHWRTRVDLTHIVAFMLFLHVVFVIMQAPLCLASSQLKNHCVNESIWTVKLRLFFCEALTFFSAECLVNLHLCSSEMGLEQQTCYIVLLMCFNVLEGRLIS